MGATLQKRSGSKNYIGYIDGQTTNPSLIARNPEIRKLVASDHRLSRQEENEEYKSIVRRISPLAGDGIRVNLSLCFSQNQRAPA